MRLALAALFVAAGLARPIAAVAAQPAPARHRHARRAEIQSRLRPFRLCKPRRAQGRRGASGGHGQLRQSQPLHRQGPGRRHRPALRDADGILGRRALQRIRPDRRKHRSARRNAIWVVFNLRPQARFHDGSPITADDVLFSFDILTHQGHAQLPGLLPERGEGRKAGRPQGPLQLRPRRQPRTAADPGPAAGAVEEILAGPQVRGDHAGAAAGQRPL